ncbi:MAG: acetylxylan esterase family protein [Aggregatilineales bacterium]
MSVAIVGLWYLNADTARITVSITGNGSPDAYSGVCVDENGDSQIVDHIVWDSSTRTLEFRRAGIGFWQWYRGVVQDGTYAGRFSHDTLSPYKPDRINSYQKHATGWNSVYFDNDIVPRVYDAVLETTSDSKRCRIRIDRNITGGFFGRMKVYATSSDDKWNVEGEALECDLENVEWDGQRFSFARDTSQGKQVFTGQAAGRNISGTYSQALSADIFSWTGTRTEVLTYGLNRKPEAERSTWQARTRSQLFNLTMAGNPVPTGSAVVEQETDVPPIASTGWLPDRDDNPARWPPNYTVTDLRLTFTIPDPYRGPAVSRAVYARLAIPTAPPAGDKPYPAVVALNGHEGSAYQALNPDNPLYWYGDAFARRGYVVLAIDISHRPTADRERDGNQPPLYDDFLDGDDPLHGSHTHPAIASSLFPHSSDWEEDGERAWDVMRAFDLLLSGQLGVEVDPQRLVITGLSMGGEIATLVGGLDRRLTVVISAGFSPDLNVMKYHGNHPCWQWIHADIGEYLDVSDLHALIASRPLIIQTGKQDTIYSSFQPPFAADKQVARRSRIAYGNEVKNLVHYLHYDEHHYHFGDVNPSQPGAERGVRQAAVIEPPSANWQTDSTTVEKPPLFETIELLIADSRE